MTKSKKRRRIVRRRRDQAWASLGFDLTVEEVMADLTYGWPDRVFAGGAREDKPGEQAA